MSGGSASRHPQLHRRRGVADRHRLQAGRLQDRDLGAQHAAPGLAEQVILVDAQCFADRVELLDEQGGCPEVGGRIGQMGAVAATDLVVVDDGAAGFVGEFGEVANVVVRHARSAVQDEKGQGAGAGIVGGGDLDPGFVAAERDHLGGTGHGVQHGPSKGLMTRPLIGI
jgi:hypothetical protein